MKRISVWVCAVALAAVGMLLSGCTNAASGAQKGRPVASAPALSPKPTIREIGKVTSIKPTGNRACKYEVTTEWGDPWQVTMPASWPGGTCPTAKATRFKIDSEGGFFVTFEVTYRVTDSKPMEVGRGSQGNPPACKIHYRADQPGPWSVTEYRVGGTEEGAAKECATVRVGQARTFTEEAHIGELTPEQLTTYPEHPRP